MSSDAVGLAWESTAPLAIARNQTVLVRASIDVVDNLVNRRLLGVNASAFRYAVKQHTFDLGVSVHFVVAYTQEDTGSRDINATVSAIQSNFSSSVDDGSFRAIFVTQLRSRGVSEDFIGRAVPASLSFASRAVTTTTYRPTVRPTRSPTAGQNLLSIVW